MKQLEAHHAATAAGGSADAFDLSPVDEALTPTCPTVPPLQLV